MAKGIISTTHEWEMESRIKLFHLLPDSECRSSLNIVISGRFSFHRFSMKFEINVYYGKASCRVEIVQFRSISVCCAKLMTGTAHRDQSFTVVFFLDQFLWIACCLPPPPPESSPGLRTYFRADYICSRLSPLDDTFRLISRETNLITFRIPRRRR